MPKRVSGRHPRHPRHPSLSCDSKVRRVRRVRGVHLMLCQGFNETTGRDCEQRALWQVRGIGGLTAVNTCKYHIVDFLEQMTDGNVPVTVLSLEQLGVVPGHNR